AHRRLRRRRRNELASAAPPVTQQDRRTVAVVVAAAAEDERSLPGVLRELSPLSPDEWIIVLDGGTADGLKQALAEPNATVVRLAQPRGSEACRAAGAGMTDADIVLFVDGKRPIPARQ